MTTRRNGLKPNKSSKILLTFHLYPVQSQLEITIFLNSQYVGYNPKPAYVKYHLANAAYKILTKLVRSASEASIQTLHHLGTFYATQLEHIVAWFN